jgi:hypothetical protein
MSAWTKFATNFFHQKQKQNSDYKFSQALKEASKVYKKTKGGSSKKQRGGQEEAVKMYKIDNDNIVECTANADGTYADDCKTLDQVKTHIDGMAEGESKNTLMEKYNLLAQPPVDQQQDDQQQDDQQHDDQQQDDQQQLLDGEDFGTSTEQLEIDAAMKKFDGSKGGKKSQKKSKKAGKKSQKKQKKAKKAGSKKSKK